MMLQLPLTDNYVVIYDLPVTFDPMQVVPVRWLQRLTRLTSSRSWAVSASPTR